MRWAISGSSAAIGTDSTGTPGYLNDLWEYTSSATGDTGEWTWMGGSSTVGQEYGGQSGVYGTLGTPASTNSPGGLDAPVNWTDASSNVWVFGGYGVDSTGTEGYLNALWKYVPDAKGAGASGHRSLTITRQQLQRRSRSLCHAGNSSLHQHSRRTIQLRVNPDDVTGSVLSIYREGFDLSPYPCQSQGDSL